jgi:hypothetical protein
VKKGLFYATAIIFAVFLALSGCEQLATGGDANNGGDSGPVRISEKPSKKKALAGYEIDLNAYITVEPAAASGQTSLGVRASGAAVRPVVWTIDDPAYFGVTAEDAGDGVFTPAATGAMNATATVRGGGEGGKDLTLTCTVTLVGESEYVEVTGITGARERSFAGASADLGGAKVEPETAT